jgi:hypothetical protein
MDEVIWRYARVGREELLIIVGARVSKTFAASEAVRAVGASAVSLRDNLSFIDGLRNANRAGVWHWVVDSVLAVVHEPIVGGLTV